VRSSTQKPETYTSRQNVISAPGEDSCDTSCRTVWQFRTRFKRHMNLIRSQKTHPRKGNSPTRGKTKGYDSFKQSHLTNNCKCLNALGAWHDSRAKGSGNRNVEDTGGDRRQFIALDNNCDRLTSLVGWVCLSDGSLFETLQPLKIKQTYKGCDSG